MHGMAKHLIQKPAGHTGTAFGCLPGIKIVNGSFEFQTPICVASPRNPTHQSCFVGLPGGWVISDYSPFMGTHFSEWAHKSLSKGSLGIGTSPKLQEYTRLLAKFEMRSCHLQRLQMEKNQPSEIPSTLWQREQCMYLHCLFHVSYGTEFVY